MAVVPAGATATSTSWHRSLLSSSKSISEFCHRPNAILVPRRNPRFLVISATLSTKPLTDEESKALPFLEVDELKKRDVGWLDTKEIEVAAVNENRGELKKEVKQEFLTRNKVELYEIFKHALITDSTIKEMNANNTLVFVIDKRADKTMVKDAFKLMFNIQAKRVNTSIRPDGTKKAFVMLRSDNNASQLAKRLGIL